jgi:hypothetical protein
VGDSENGSGRRLVTSSGLDTDESVLDNINSSNTVLSSKGVKGQEDLDSVGNALSVGRGSDLDGNTLEELDSDLLRGLGSLLGRSGELPHVIGRSLVGVLEDTGLVRNVEEVLVGRPGLGSSLDNGDTVGSGVLEESGSTGESLVELWGLAGLQTGQIAKLRTRQSPRGNDVDVGGKTVERKLESDLIVALSGTTVRDEACLSAKIH